MKSVKRRIKTGFAAALLVAAAMCITPTLGQDSVSTNPDGGNGLPGDALQPWDLTHQCAAYVVDLTPFSSSRGNAFAVGPIVKSSKTSSDFFGSLTSAQGLSATMLEGVPYPSNSYAVWMTPGAGVNFEGPEAPNSKPMLIGPPDAMSNQMGAAFAEFATNNGGGGVNNVITGIINWDPADTRRLFITRVVSAINNSSIDDPNNLAQVGLGHVDADGNTYFRADDFGTTGPNSILDNNYFRISSLSRDCAALNIISNLGGSDAAATDWILENSEFTHNTPSCIPAGVSTHPRGAAIGSNFEGQYVHELVAGSVTPAASDHRPGTTDQRGNVAFAKDACFEGSVGTVGMIGRSIGGGELNDSLAIWGVDAVGNVAGTRLLIVPDSVDDLCEPLSMPFTGNPLEDFFHHDSSQVAFRGGNGPLAMGADQEGNWLVAAVAYDQATFGGNDDPFNVIAVARFNPDEGGPPSWSLAAWNEFADMTFVNGKTIRDADGAAIGELAALFEVTLGAPIGPSMSAPAMDSVGNIWFLSAIQLYMKDVANACPADFDGSGAVGAFDLAVLLGAWGPCPGKCTPGDPDETCQADLSGDCDVGPFDLAVLLGAWGPCPPALQPGGAEDDDDITGDLNDRFSTGLIRAIYDPATFCYTLELVLRNGWVFTGQNSVRDWQIQFLEIADSNSVSSGTVWSGNINQCARNNMSIKGLETSDPRTLGGLVLAAEIVYDVDQDGDFDDPTAGGGDPDSADESYQVLLFVAGD